MKITENEALYAARMVYPKAEVVKQITKGYSHKIFEIKTNEYPEKVIIKFANSKKDYFSLEKEKRVHILMQELGVPVPRVLFLNSLNQDFPLDFIMLSYADGVDLDKIWNKLSLKEQCEIFEQIGEIAGKIHRKTFDVYGYLTPDSIYNRHDFSLKKVQDGEVLNPSELSILADSFFDFARIVCNTKIDEDFKLKLIRFLIKNKELLYSEEKPSLIHGDLDLINIRIKKIKNKWIICSVIDFEYTASTTKEYDFLKLHRKGYFEKPPLKDSLIRGYSKYYEVPIDFEKKIKFMRITRDIGFLGLMFKVGNFEFANKILDYLRQEI